MVAMSDLPALTELARLATEAKEAAEAVDRYVATAPARYNGDTATGMIRVANNARQALASACSPAVVLQLVALATGGAAGQQQDQPHEGKTENGQPQAPQKSGRSVPRCTTTTPE